VTVANQTEVAEHLGITRRTVYNLTRRGILPDGERGRLDIDACRVAYLRHLRDMGEAPGTLALTAERARLAKEQADGWAARNARRREELLDAGDAERTWAEALHGIRAVLLAVPARVRARLPRLTPAEAAIIDREVRDALAEIGPADDA
jgi:phage terminase Nu1 subunit (DNA packaging protein)